MVVPVTQGKARKSQEVKGHRDRKCCCWLLCAVQPVHRSGIGWRTVGEGVRDPFCALASLWFGVFFPSLSVFAID